MAETKTVPTQENVADYLNRISDERARADCFQLVEMMKQASGEDAQMWGAQIVGFGRSPYRYASGQEGIWPTIAFSPRKQALTLYLTAEFERRQELLNRLGKHTTGKGCVYIKRLADVDQAVLAEMLRNSYAERRRNHPANLA